MKTSIILTVYNWEKTLKKCLESLLIQSYSDYEVIVVNDFSNDATKKIVNEYKNKIKVINNDKNYGRAKSKNIWINLAEWEIVVFTEDDATYDKDYLKNAVKHFEDPTVIWVIWPYEVMNKNYNIITKSISYERLLNFKNYKPFSMWFYRKTDLIEIWGFDENLEFWEDITPYLKIKKDDNKVIFEPKSKWKHLEPVSLRKLLIRKFKWWIWMAWLYKKWYKKLNIPFLVIQFYIIFVFWITYINYYLGIILFLSTLILFLIINSKNINYIKKKTQDNLFDIILWFYIKFIWRLFTVIWYSYWLLLNSKQIKKILKWR